MAFMLLGWGRIWHTFACDQLTKELGVERPEPWATRTPGSCRCCDAPSSSRCCGDSHDQGQAGRIGPRSTAASRTRTRLCPLWEPVPADDPEAADVPGLLPGEHRPGSHGITRPADAGDRPLNAEGSGQLDDERASWAAPSRRQ